MAESTEIGRPQCPLSVSDDTQSQSEDNEKPFEITRPVLLTVFLGEFLASVDDSLVVSTYPTIASEFHDLSDGLWLLVAYSFGYCVSSPVYGVLGDIYGRKNVVLWSSLLCILACAACGASVSMVQLILSRALAGISAAGMVSLVSVIMTDAAPPKEVAIFRNYTNITNIIGRSLGAPIGGLLAGTVGWRWSFYGQLPFFTISFLITAFKMPSWLNQTLQEPTESKLQRIDFLGIISLTATMLLLLVLLQSVDFDTIDQSPLFFLLGGLFVGVGSIFLLIEMYWAENPLIPVDMIEKACGGYCLAQMFLAVGRSAFGLSTVPYFIRVENASGFVASLANLAFMVSVPIGDLVSGFWIRRTDHYKTISLVTASIMALSYLTIFSRWRNGCNAWETLLLFPFGFIIGIQHSTQYTGMTTSVPKSRIGQCTGTFHLIQQLGYIIGPVFSLANVEQLFKGSLWRNFMNLGPEKESVISNIVNDARFAFSLSGSDQVIVRSCYLKAYQFVPILGFVCALLALLIMTFLQERPIQV